MKLYFVAALLLGGAGASAAAPSSKTPPPSMGEAAFWRNLDWRNFDTLSAVARLAPGPIPNRTTDDSYPFAAKRHGQFSLAGMLFAVEEEALKSGGGAFRLRAFNKDDPAGCETVRHWGDQSFGPHVEVDNSIDMSSGQSKFQLIDRSSQWKFGSTRITEMCFGTQGPSNPITYTAIVFEDVSRTADLRPISTITCQLVSESRMRTDVTFRIDDNRKKVLRLDNSPLEESVVRDEQIEGVTSTSNGGDKVTLTVNRITGRATMTSEKLGYLSSGDCSAVTGRAKF